MTGSAMAPAGRERWLVLGFVAVLTALAWAYLFRIAAQMNMAAMPGMATAAVPGPARWGPADFALTWFMWAVMMAAMMLPSATPMILMHAAVGRDAARRGQRWAATTWFAAGYLGAWTAFSLVATAVQWALQRAAWLTPMLAPARPALAAAVLLLAGLYQWMSFKAACLGHCRSPLQFLVHHGGFRTDPAGSFLQGTRHGAYCVGCCWALMALLFAGGVMNLAWVAVLGALVLAEKVMPGGIWIARVTGLACFVAAAMVLR